jgi:DNA-binding SARP family transcriptional activator
VARPYIRAEGSAGYPALIGCLSAEKIEHQFFRLWRQLSMFRLQLLGGCALRFDGEPLSGAAVQPRRLALIALAASHRTGLSRDKLIAYLWPDEDRERARHFLADSLFTIRKSLGSDVFISTGSDVRVNRESVCADLWMFEDACARGDFVSAAALYHGPFLDGFFISNAQEFERWAATERERLVNAYGNCLERRAEELERDGEYCSAVEWWTRLSLHDPYSSRITVRTMHAQEKSGDSVAAIQHAAKYEKLVRTDLDLAPDPDVLVLAEKLRARLSVETQVARHNLGSRTRSATHLKSGNREPVVESAALRTPLSSSHVSRHHGAIRHWMMIASWLIVSIAAIAVGNRVMRQSPRVDIKPVLAGRRTSFAAGTLTDKQTKRTPREEAEELYHEGRLALTTLPMRGRFNDAMALYRRSLEIEPTYARAYAGMADAYSYNGDYRNARDAALKALSLDGQLPEAHTSLAYVLAFYEHHWHAADSELVRAIRSSPRFTLAHLRRAYIQAVLGQVDSAMVSAERAHSIEPESWTVLFNRGMIESAVGRPMEAIRDFEAALNMEPGRPDVKIHLALEYRTAGRKQAAAAVLHTLGENSCVAVVARGDSTEMRSWIAQYERAGTRVEQSCAARLYAQLGNRDAAFTELRNAIWTDRYIPLALRHEPLASLKDDPRYVELLKDFGVFKDADAVPRRAGN